MASSIVPVITEGKMVEQGIENSEYTGKIEGNTKSDTKQLHFPKMGVLQVEKKNIPKLAWNLHRYRPDIDGLRAVAVIFVIIFHLDPTWIKGAFVGVDIFFVISGFVVSMSMLKPRDKNGEMRTPCEFFCSFYARRIKRLWPALLLVWCVSGLLTSMFPGSRSTMADVEEHFNTGLISLIGGGNIYLSTLVKKQNPRTKDLTCTNFLNSTDLTIAAPPSVSQNGGSEMTGGYFRDVRRRRLAASDDHRSPGHHKLHQNPFLHSWSLGVEEQFYLIFPVITLVTYSQRVGVRVPQIIHRWCGGQCMWILITLASFVLCWQLSASLPHLAFYMMPSRLWQLMSGAILYELLATFKGFYTYNWQVLRVLEIFSAVLLGSGFVFASPKHFPLPWSLPAVCGTLCFIVAGTMTNDGHRGFNTVLSWSPVVYIGKISYPLYLWHWPIFVIFDRTVGLIDYWYYQLTATALSFFAAAFTYHFIENKIKFWRPKYYTKIFWKALPCTIVVAIVLLLLRGPLLGVLCISKCPCFYSNTCVKQQSLRCMTPKIMPFQRIGCGCKNNSAIGNICILRCKTGYFGSNSIAGVCKEDSNVSTSRFHGQNITCSPCKSLTHCSHGSLKCTNAKNSVCTECEKGYYGSHCESKSMCLGYHVKPPLVVRKGCKAGARSGSECSLGCKMGYFPSKSTTGICHVNVGMSTGRFQGQNVTCVPCSPVANCMVGVGALTCTNITNSLCTMCEKSFIGDRCLPIGTQCVVGCAPGYFATSLSIGICTPNDVTGANIKAHNQSCNPCSSISGCQLDHIRCTSNNNSICISNSTASCQAPNVSSFHTIVTGCANNSSLGSVCILGCKLGYFSNHITVGMCTQFGPNPTQTRFQGQESTTCKPCESIKNCKIGAVSCTSATDAICMQCKDNFRGIRCQEPACPAPEVTSPGQRVRSGCIANAALGATCDLSCAEGYFELTYDDFAPNVQFLGYQGVCTLDSSLNRAFFRGQRAVCRLCTSIPNCKDGGIRCTNQTDSHCIVCENGFQGPQCNYQTLSDSKYNITKPVCSCSYASAVRPLHQPTSIDSHASKPCFIDTTGFVKSQYSFESSLNIRPWMWQSFTTTSELVHYYRPILAKNKRRGKPHGFLIGDSTGMQMANNLQWALASHGYTMSHFYTWSTIQSYLWWDGGAAYGNTLADMLADLAEDSDIIVFSYYDFGRTMVNYNGLDGYYGTFLAQLRDKTTAHIVIADNFPSPLSENGVEWLKIQNANNPGVNYENYMERTSSLRKNYQDFATRHDKTHIWHYGNKLCNDTGGFCGPFVPGTKTLAYMDTYHLTPQGAFYFWPFMCEELNQILSGR